MSRVLVVDDMAIFREPIAACIRREGCEVMCAANGSEALQAVREAKPDLILLDVAMPVMDGLTCLKALRADPQTRNIPVVMLTAMSERQAVIQAAQAGVEDYMLKASFSIDELRSRLRKHLRSPSGPDTAPPAPEVVTRPAPPARASSATQTQAPVTSAARRMVEPAASTATAVAPAGRPRAQARQAPAGPQEAAEENIPSLLTREATVARIHRYLEAKTLAGTVVEVVALCGSSRASAQDIVGALKHDPIIASRVVQVANSAAYSTNKPKITTLDEAVRNIGFGTVRNIASSVGFYEAFPSEGADGFNTLRCWQHCLAVATIMDRFASALESVPPGLPHLVGLCHDVGEIVLRQLFAEEFSLVLSFAARSQKPQHVIESAVFGMCRSEIVLSILETMNLPTALIDAVRNVLCRKTGDRDPTPLARVLRLADYCAHACLLASSVNAPVGPVTKLECCNTLGTTAPVPLDWAAIRAEVLTLTHLLARLSSADAKRMSDLMIPATHVDVWYGRDPSFAALDPLGAALQFLARPSEQTRLPERPEELADCQGMVLVTPEFDNGPFAMPSIVQFIRSAAATALPVLYLVRQGRQVLSSPAPNVQVRRYPITLAELGEFTSSLSPESRSDDGPR